MSAKTGQGQKRAKIVPGGYRGRMEFERKKKKNLPAKVNYYGVPPVTSLRLDDKIDQLWPGVSQALAWHVRGINEGEPTGWKRAMTELGQIDIQT